MFTNDDKDSARIGDRLIAAGFAGVFAYLFGALFVFILSKFSVEVAWLKWLLAGIAATYGFAAPSRSRELWSQVWEELLGFFGGGGR